jgi:hypothetical protein
MFDVVFFDLSCSLFIPTILDSVWQFDTYGLSGVCACGRGRMAIEAGMRAAPREFLRSMKWLNRDVVLADNGDQRECAARRAAFQ